MQFNKRYPRLLYKRVVARLYFLRESIARLVLGCFFVVLSYVVWPFTLPISFLVSIVDSHPESHFVEKPSFLGIRDRYLSTITTLFFRIPFVKWNMCFRDLKIPMRDGHVLLARHFFLRGKENTPAPVILVRTPYDRSVSTGCCLRMASHGFHVIEQACRHIDISTEFPLLSEEHDGVDTISWIDQQDFCDGNIGMWGVSYLGLAQYAVCDSLPKKIRSKVKAFCPIFSSTDLYELICPNGVLHLEFVARWMYLLERVFNPRLRPGSKLTAGLKTIWKIMQTCNQLPISVLDSSLMNKKAKFFQDLVTYPYREHPYWNEGNIKIKLCKLRNCPPSLVIAGWYDVFGKRSLKDFMELQEISSNHRLIVGPWSHFDIFPLFRAALSPSMDWFDEQFYGKKTTDDEKRVQIYMMGINRWMYFPSYPPPEARSMVLSLEKEGSLMVRKIRRTSQKGLTKFRLRSDSDNLNSFDEYIYDPKNPTPVIGGASFDHYNSGRRDNSSIEHRDDILVYTSKVLKEDLMACGPIIAELYVSSDNDYSHFVARILDVHPNGRSDILCDGICKFGEGSLMNAGEEEEVKQMEDVCMKSKGSGNGFASNRIRRVEIDLGATGNVFRKGHQIRIHIASSAHPRWMRGLGVGPPEEEVHADIESAKKCHQKVYHKSSKIYLTIL